MLSTDCFINFSSIIMDTVDKLKELVVKERQNREKIQELIDERNRLKVSEREHARKYEELTSKAAECASKLVTSEKRVVELAEENNRLRNELKEEAPSPGTPKKSLLDLILDLFK